MPRATARDRLRDRFGRNAQFTALVADGRGRIVGMLTTASGTCANA